MNAPSTNQNTRGDDRGSWTSASAAHADSLCAGRHIAQQGLPEPAQTKEEQEWAEFGIRVHDALEKSDSSGLKSDELESYEECKVIEQAALAKYFGKSVAAAIKPAVREHRLWISIAPELWHSGRLDMWYRYKEKALIVEYKALRGPVPESPANPQLRDQAVLLYYNVPLLSEVAVTVAQPPANHDPIITVYDALDISHATIELSERVRASNNPRSTRTAGEVQCQYCKAKVLCEAYAEWIAREMPIEIPALRSPTSLWTVEQWDMFLERAPLAEAWLKQTKMIAKEMLKKDPKSIPGWRLQPTGSIETVTDPQELFSRFEKLGGKLPGFMACLDVGKGKFKDLLAATTGAKGKALEHALDTLFSGIITSKEKEPSIKKVK